MPRDAKTVLLVEDEDNIALALEVLIDRQGHATRRVATGEDALVALEEDAPDLVILDVMLPKVSGFEVCQHIRDTEALKGTKVLMMSAAGPIAQTKGLAIGADAFFPKPFDPGALTREISNLLGGSDAA